MNTPNEALIWFLITIVLFLFVLVGGIYEATHSYDLGRTSHRRHHWWQRH